MHFCLQDNLSDTGRRHSSLRTPYRYTLLPVGSVDTFIPAIILEGILRRSPCFEKDQAA